MPWWQTGQSGSTRVDGHAGWANTAAPKAAGVTAASKAPPGGELIQSADGAPTGVLVDNASELVSRTCRRRPRAIMMPR